MYKGLKYQYCVLYRVLGRQRRLAYRNLSRGDGIRNREPVRNGGNANQMKVFCYETSGFDRINTNTHLRIIKYRKQLSVMVGRTVTLMMSPVESMETLCKPWNF